MLLSKISLTQFRNFNSVSLENCAAINVFLGRNGSGKTSLLEAIYLFGFGRSFRSRSLSKLINKDHSQFTLFLQGSTEQGSLSHSGDVRLGMSRDDSGQQVIKANGDVVKRVSDIARLLPVQLFTPQSSDVLTGSPSERRKFLDWGLFHVEQSYYEVSNRYRRVLQQRNALLKQKGSFDDNLDRYWCEQLIRFGEMTNELRRNYISMLLPYIEENCRHFVPEFQFEFLYQQGWNKEHKLEFVLQKNSQRDRMRGFSGDGPHKADLIVKADGINASELLSRGQLRVLMAAMQLAQTQLLNAVSNRKTTFLLDDLGAELDTEKRSLFLNRLMECESQIFVTAIDQNQVALPENSSDIKVFHVEHGQVTERR